MTWVMSCTSMPRAATSVATRTSTLPLRNARSACSRAPWPRSPCTAPAANPRSVRSSATFAAVRLVRQKTRVSPRPSACRMRASISTLSIACARNTCCSTALTVCAVVVGVDRADVRGVVHVLAGQRDDLAGHRRREEHRLAAGGDQPDDLLDVGQEAEVEHLVGLVEDQGAHLAEAQQALLGQVDQPARGADDDLDALAQRLDLGLVGAAAVDREDADVAGARRLLQVAGDLHAQLAGGYDDEGLRPAGFGQVGEALVGGRDDALQQGDAEAQRLAGAGLGLADDVVPVQRDRQGQRLDRERVGDADRLEGRHGGRQHPQVGKRGCVHSGSQSRASFALLPRPGAARQGQAGRAWKTLGNLVGADRCADRASVLCCHRYRAGYAEARD